MAFAESESFGYAEIDVQPGSTYTVNSTGYSNNFSVVVDSNNIIIDKLSAFATEDISTAYTMPDNASKIVLCNSQLSATGNKNIVVLSLYKRITDTTIYNTDTYPYGTVVGVSIDNLYEPGTSNLLKDTLDSLRDSVNNPVLDNSYSYQYIDKILWTEGSRWHNSSGSITQYTSSGYYYYPMMHLNAGNYQVNNISKNFSFAVINGVITPFSQILVDGTITLISDADVYISTNNDINYAMLSTGDFNYENLHIQYVYGKYNCSINHVFYVGSKRNIKTLKEGLEKAEEYFDSYVYIDAEDFDLIEEFGAEYLENYDGSERMIGLMLKNRVHVIFSSGARVLFNYTGNNENVHIYFSPFNAGPYGFEIENAWVESKNCRYTVHDELDSSKVPYRNIYRRCTFIHDSRGTSYGASRAIGGGLGLHGDILIEDCYAYSEGAASIDMPVISYHNATSTTEESKSNIVLRGCYLGTTFRCTNQGLSTTKSRATVTNCSVLTAPRLETTITDVRADNMELYAWNNTIRENQ